MKRLFIAVPINDAARNQIYGSIIQNEYAKKLPVRWSSVQNLHLTLQFLGDVEEKRISVLKEILNRTKAPETKEELTFTGIGTFPNPSSPRVIWLGIRRNEYLEKMQRELTRALIDNGFEADTKKYKAHLTLGRVRENAVFPSDGLTNLGTIRENTVIDNSNLDKITLFESQLRPGGPIYTSVYEKKFN